jgi:hypothetical protein
MRMSTRVQPALVGTANSVKPPLGQLQAARHVQQQGGEL